MFHTGTQELQNSGSNGELNAEFTTFDTTEDTNVTNCNRSISSDLEDIKTHGHLLDDKILGFAVKLSIIDKFDLDFSVLLKLTESKILIDAEFDRLDLWLENQVQSGKIDRQDLDRLIITVQVRRRDAEEQITNLNKYRKFGLEVLVVTGHKAYLKYTELADNVERSFSKLFVYDHVKLIGTGQNMIARVQQLSGTTIESDQVLELQGYHSFENSMLWSYYAGHELTDNAINYLDRRNSDNQTQFICQTVSQIANLDHQLYLFVDGCCKMHYLQVILAFSTNEN